MKANPSALGGTWAFCQISAEDKIIDLNSGIITPETWELEAITNNVAELYAALRALTGVPEELVDWTIATRKRVDCRWQLVDGHPTKQQLETGIGKTGAPVSRWNVWCDVECQRQAQGYFVKQEMQRGRRQDAF